MQNPSIEIPKLPSIQSMLKGVTLSVDTQPPQSGTRSIGHRRHTSEQTSAFNLVDSMHGKLEKLSLHAIPLEPKIQHHNNTSSSSASPPINNYNHLPFRISHIQNHHRSPRNLHSRSFSDYTHPYQASSPPRSSGSQLAPLQPTFHRRTVSTNTLDLILQPLMQRPLDQYNPPQLYASSSASSTTTNAPYSPTNGTAIEERGYTSDESTTTRSTSPLHSSSAAPNESQQQQQSASCHQNGNKYSCSFCSKGFSRPSSLRIHTYSHTGERPFECPEQGCSRKFSVQSNMRRHLRVHRLGRPLKRNGGLISTADRAQLINKPLAAKPTNWIGTTSSQPQLNCNN